MLMKPSLLTPGIGSTNAEIDITQSNTFSCQINSSSTTVKAYKFQMYSGDGNDLIYDGNAQQLGVNHFVKNKDRLEFQVTPSMLGSSNKVKNGRDYQYSVRVYEQNLSSSLQPRTPVCSGYIVGSTKQVIFTQNNTDLIEEDMYIEITAANQSAIIPPTPPNDDNITYPKEYPYRERHKIEFVDKELGWEKAITKITTDEAFTYNYYDGTQFQIYHCSDAHTLTSIYVDPNDIIERGKYVKINNVTVNGSNDKWRKIIGYSEFGEIRVAEAFNALPTNGLTFSIGKMNIETDKIEDITSEGYATGKNVLGGVPLTTTYTTMSNSWTSSTKRLFIQPNINIKSDATNSDEIIFDINGETIRVDIIQSLNTTGNLIPGKSIVDTTFDKLDNTQWLLRVGNLRLAQGSTVPTSPQTPYQVFTDFQDSMPLAYFYARKTPNIRIYFGDYNETRSGSDYEPQPIPENIDAYLPGVPWRDIKFITHYTSENNVEIKYYQYRLYTEDDELIAESEELYDTDLYWQFRGFQTPDDPTLPGKIYRIEIRIVDQYNKEFVVSNSFRVKYEVGQSYVPISTKLNCDERCIDIKVTTPAFVKTTDWEEENKETVTVEDINKIGKYLQIPEGKVLNYTNLKDLASSPYTIPNDFALYTQFQITGDFADSIKPGEEQMVLEFSYENTEGNDDIVKLTFGGIDTYYMENDMVTANEKRFKLFLYINDEPANLFKNSNSEMVNYIDLSMTTANFITAGQIRYAVQNRQAGNFNVINAFPVDPKVGIVYLLNNSYIYNNITYKPGPYVWESKEGWQIQKEYEYFFLENLNQVQNATYESLNVPTDCQAWYNLGKDKKEIYFNDGTNGSNVWVDNENIKQTNKEILNKYWYELYFVSKGDKKTCQFKVNSYMRK